MKTRARWPASPPGGPARGHRDTVPCLDTGRVRRLQGLLGSAERLDTSGRGLLNFEMRMVISPAAESSSGRSENTRVLTHARLHPSPAGHHRLPLRGGSAVRRVRGSPAATRSLVLPLAGRVVNCSRPCRSSCLESRRKPPSALHAELGDPDAHRTGSRLRRSPIPGELNPKHGLEPRPVSAPRPHSARDPGGKPATCVCDLCDSELFAPR